MQDILDAVHAVGDGRGSSPDLVIFSYCGTLLANLLIFRSNLLEPFVVLYGSLDHSRSARYTWQAPGAEGWNESDLQPKTATGREI